MSITGANAVIMITVPGVFPAPQQLQGFAADEVMDSDQLESAETLMGVDGKMSAGFVFVPFNQAFTLMADSESIPIFDAWWTTQQQAREIFYASGVIILTAVRKKWAMTKGALVGYKPIPDTKKLLQAQKFGIRWERVLPAVTP